MSNGFSNATIHNLGLGEALWTSDFKATRDDKNTWTGSESFFCRIESVFSLLPVKGAPCNHPGFGIMRVNTVDVNNYEGNIYQVTIGYKGRSLGEDESSGEPAEGTYTTELAITTGEEPIESHPKYRSDESDITAEEWTIIRNFKSGKFIPTDVAYQFIDINNHLKAKPWTVASVYGKELLDFYANGVESYLAAYQTWRVTFTSEDLPTADILNYVGFITTAKGAPPISDNRNWLFMGCNVSQNGDIYTITYEWRLSGIGGWQPKIYNKNNV